MKSFTKILLSWHYTIPLLFAFLTHASLLAMNYGYFLDGGLVAHDSYLRLTRVSELFHGADWFDQPFPRANAPFGYTLHWTRPFDVLLLLGAGTLTPFFGFDRALHWAGVAISPVVHLAIVASLVWGLAPVFDRQRRVLAAVVFVFQPVAFLYSVSGRADHHGLILLSFTLLLGFAIRIMAEKDCSRRTCLLAGAAAGFGLWVSIEFLVALFLVLGALAVRWGFDGRAFGRRGIHLALGLFVMVTVALAAEQSPAHLLQPVYDRISIVHWALAAAVIAFYAALALLDRKVLVDSGATARLVAVLLLAAILIGVFWIIYPKFFQDPLYSYDPRLLSYLQALDESLRVIDFAEPRFGRLLFYLGAALVALPFSVWLVIREAKGGNRPVWLMLTAMLGVYLILNVHQLRWGIYVGVLVAPALAELVKSVADVLDRRGSQLRRICAYGVITLLLGLAPFMVGKRVGALESVSRLNPRAPACSLAGLSRFLNDPAGFGSQSRTILAPTNFGPELLYRTPHRVVATGDHRNAAGILDLFAIMGTTDLEEARRMLAAREVDLILLCPSGTRPDGSRPDASFYDRLVDNRLPEWLHDVALPPGVGDSFLLFEMRRPEGGRRRAGGR